MDAKRLVTIRFFIFGATVLFAGCSHDNHPDRYRELDLVDSSRPLSDMEAEVVATLETIPGSLWDTVAADLDGDDRDEIIVLAKEGDFAMLGRTPTVSGIVRIESGKIRYLYHFPPTYINSDPLVVDMNGDGVADLVYTSFSGGTRFNSGPQVIVWWDGNAYRHQDIGEWKKIYDFDGDGALELETVVELQAATICALDCDTAMSGVREIQYAPSMVWGWRDGIPCDISEEVPFFFRDVRLPALASKRLEMEKTKQEYSGDGFADVMDCLLGCLELVEARASNLAGAQARP